MLARCSTRVTSISHETHQLTDFTTLAELLPAVTEPSAALHTYYDCRTSSRHLHVCDFTYPQEKNTCMNYAPTLASFCHNTLRNIENSDPRRKHRIEMKFNTHNDTDERFT
ncbi:UNVERIFIED_CONTAM: hypothetical protein NCL1_21329 [Trichonephila clavipes]